MAEKCDACNGRLEEDFISDYASMAVDQRPCGKCRGDGVLRAGPYRLDDGGWSDGVDRTRVIPSHEFSKANPDRVYVHGTWDQDDLGRWKPYFDVWRGDTCIKTGWPFAEAIAYADNLARTTKNGDNK